MVRFNDHDIVLVEMADGVQQPFYRSTGRNSRMPGRWFPFDGIMPTGPSKNWFIKDMFAEGIFGDRANPLYRYGGRPELKEIGDQLGQASIPKGREIADNVDVNKFLRKPTSIEELAKQAPTPARVAGEAVEEVPEEIVLSGIEALGNIINKGGPKATILRRLERLLAKDPDNIYTDEYIEGLDDIEGLIDEYRGIEKQGMTPEDFIDEKQNAFDEIVDHINDALEPVERELGEMVEEVIEEATPILREIAEEGPIIERGGAVSYTHLTLPTIYSV